MAVKKGKARKYFKLATSDIKKKPRAITKYQVLSLADYKTAKSKNKLSKLKLITNMKPAPNNSAANEDMKHISDSEN